MYIYSAITFILYFYKCMAVFYINKVNTTPAVESDGCSSSSLEDNCSIAWDSTATNPSLKSSNVTYKSNS